MILDQVELPHVLDLAVHLVNLVGWMVKGDHYKTFLLELFFMVISNGVVGVVGVTGWWPTAIIVTAQVPRLRDLWIGDSGLSIFYRIVHFLMFDLKHVFQANVIPFLK